MEGTPVSDAPMASTAPTQLSFGQQLVGINFNPAGDSKVDSSYTKKDPELSEEIKTRKEKIIKKIDLLFKEPSSPVLSTRLESEKIIEKYSRYWMEIIGTRGFKGKKTVSARPQFNTLFEVVDDTTQEHSDEFTEDEVNKLDELEAEVK